LAATGWILGPLRKQLLDLGISSPRAPRLGEMFPEMFIERTGHDALRVERHYRRYGLADSPQAPQGSQRTALGHQGA
jgi:hypothetical protein